MRIGLDIDNVITDFDEAILNESLIEDKNKRNKGIINKNATHIVHGMFDWSKDEINEFFSNNMQRIAQNLKPKQNCREIMKKLKEEGNEIYLISHRAYPDYTSPYKLTTNWLIENEIPYDKLILSKSPDKTEECLKNKIDIMIDDRVDQCKKMIDKGINAYIFKTKYTNNYNTYNIPIIENWYNLYKVINNEKNKRNFRHRHK